MRWTAKSSLFAGVAAAALAIGPVPDASPISANSLRDLVPLQLGTTAEAQASLSVGVFFDRLAPHGRWARHSSHGHVFIPANVRSDWRPYTDGRWVYTDAHGWYWASDEPFGWATYHYGRWGYSRAYGWFWVPGNVWAPAWVTWRTGGDVIGWAPIAPEGDGYAWGAPTVFRPPVAESWVFVELRYINAPTLVQYVTPIVEIPRYLQTATTRVDIRIEQNIVINQPIEITQIQNVVVEPIETVELDFTDDPDQASADAEVVFQAELSEEDPQEAPAEAAESAEEIEDPALLEETLDEVPAEADAPSASEVTDEGSEDSGEPGDDEPASGQSPAGEDSVEDEPAEVDQPAETTEPAAAQPGDEEPTEPTPEPAADEPIADEEPAEAPQEPAATEQPAQAEEPVGEEQAVEPEQAPADAEQPAQADDAPAEAEQPAAAEPEESEQPAQAQQPSEAKQPEDAGEPAEVDEPADAGEPVGAEPCPEGQQTC